MENIKDCTAVDACGSSILVARGHHWEYYLTLYINTNHAWDYFDHTFFRHSVVFGKDEHEFGTSTNTFIEKWKRTKGSMKVKRQWKRSFPHFRLVKFGKDRWVAYGEQMAFVEFDGTISQVVRDARVASSLHGWTCLYDEYTIRSDGLFHERRMGDTIICAAISNSWIAVGFTEVFYIWDWNWKSRYPSPIWIRSQKNYEILFSPFDETHLVVSMVNSCTVYRMDHDDIREVNHYNQQFVAFTGPFSIVLRYTISQPRKNHSCLSDEITIIFSYRLYFQNYMRLPSLFWGIPKQKYFQEWIKRINPRI